MSFVTNVDCIFLDKEKGCINSKRKWFFGLLQDCSCPEKKSKNCDLKENRDKPEPPLRPPIKRYSK